MKKFGFGKKSDNAQVAAARKPETPPPAYSDNPYAAQPVNDDPYAGQKYANMPGLPSGPRAGGLPSGPGPRSSPAPRGGPAPRDANPYAAGGASGYGSGSSNGYGANINSYGANSNAGAANGYGASNGYAASSNYSGGFNTTNDSSSGDKISSTFSARPSAPSSKSSGPTDGFSAQKYGTTNSYGKGVYGQDSRDRRPYNNDAHAANQKISALPPGAKGPAGFASAALGNPDDWKLQNEKAFASNQKYEARAAGGYGGLGPADDDANKDALFADLRDRRGQGEAYMDYAKDAGQVVGGAGSRYGDPNSRNDLLRPGQDRYGQQRQGVDNKYGGYGEQRELTEEEQEQEMLRGYKSDIRQEKMATIDTGNRILQTLGQIEGLAMSSISKLETQGESLHNTEMQLDLAASHNKRAEQETKTLKQLNRSMFVPAAGNPFTSKKRTEAEQRKILEIHHAEKELAAATRKARYDTNQGVEQNHKQFGRLAPQYQPISAAEKSKYSFKDEDDDGGSDSEKEEEINRQLSDIEFGLKKANLYARTVGSMVDQQNKTIDRIAEKTDGVDDGVRMNRDALQRIGRK